MATAGTIVYIIDDDASVRTALVRLLCASGLEPRPMASLEEFLACGPVDRNACLIADVRLAGTNGPELSGLLAARGLELPLIFVTAQDTQEARDAARRLGAAAYFRKPVDDQALLDAISWAAGPAGDATN